MTTKRTRYVDVRFHVIRYWHKEDVLDFTYTETNGQLADIMTKVLTGPPFRRHRAQCMPDTIVDDVDGPFRPPQLKP